MVRSSLLNELSGLKTIMVGGSIKNLFSIHVSFFGCFSHKQDTKIIYKKVLHKNDLEKGFEEWIIVQWGTNLQKALRSYHPVPDKLKCCSRKQFSKGTFKHSRTKNHRRRKRRKSLQRSAKTERPLAVCMTIKKNDTPPQTSLENIKNWRKTFSWNTIGELQLVFQLFMQFDLGIWWFILKFQKFFYFRIFKNGYTFLHFLRVCRNVLP